jgi:hypothetical protein
MFILDEPDPKEMEAINTARADPRISSIHENLLKLIEATLSIWSGDALISDVSSCLPRHSLQLTKEAEYI